MLIVVIFDNMETLNTTTNVAISVETHKLLVVYIQSIDGKIGKFVDKAIREKMIKDKK